MSTESPIPRVTASGQRYGKGRRRQKFKVGGNVVPVLVPLSQRRKDRELRFDYAYTGGRA